MLNHKSASTAHFISLTLGPIEPMMPPSLAYTLPAASMKGPTADIVGKAVILWRCFAKKFKIISSHASIF